MKNLFSKKQGVRLFLVVTLLTLLLASPILAVTSIESASGKLELLFPEGNPEGMYVIQGSPMIRADDLFPGDSVEKTDITIRNNTEFDRYVGFFIEENFSTDTITDVLYLTVTDARSSETLIDYIPLSQILLERDIVDLSEATDIFLLDSSSSKVLDIKITFDENAGNEYQNQTVNFDLGVGFTDEEGNILSEDSIILSGRVLAATGGNYFAMTVGILTSIIFSAAIIIYFVSIYRKKY